LFSRQYCYFVKGQQMVNLLPFVLFLKAKHSKPAARVLPDAILLSGNKSMQKGLLLAEGISFAGFLWSLRTTLHEKPARYRGAFLAG